MTFYNYVDIGTSNFGTSLKNRKLEETILLVEPINFYLNQLPSGDGIIKYNAAISNSDYVTSIFFISLENIEKYKLPSWFRGCNSIGKKHPTIMKKIEEDNLPDSIVEESSIEVISFITLIKKFNIEEIGQLKIDTEGHDHIILENVLDAILQKQIKNIKRIVFEYEVAFNNTIELDRLVNKFVSIGYKDLGFHKNNKIIEI